MFNHREIIVCKYCLKAACAASSETFPQTPILITRFSFRPRSRIYSAWNTERTAIIVPGTVCDAHSSGSQLQENMFKMRPRSTKRFSINLKRDTYIEIHSLHPPIRFKQHTRQLQTCIRRMPVSRPTGHRSAISVVDR